MKYIKVIFTTKKLSYEEYQNRKEYVFLYPYDSIKFGDIIEDLRYSTPMQVIALGESINTNQFSFRLEVIKPFKLNGKPFIQEKLNNMETRKIEVTIQQAREWYESNNEALRELAITTYTEEELQGSSYIISQVPKSLIYIEVPKHDKSIPVNSTLAIIAKYFNKDWEMKPGRVGYFIGKSTSNGSSVIKVVDCSQGINIYEHRTVQYAGIVYFKSAECAKRAAELLGDYIEHLF